MNKKIRLIKFFIILISLYSINIFYNNNAFTIEPNEALKDEKLELRARNISKNIRCMICQNQSIDESSSPLAKDLRILIRKKIKDGHSDKQIYKFLTDRYGDFILLKPPFKLSTFALWVLPFIFLIFGIYFVFLHNKKSKIKI